MSKKTLTKIKKITDNPSEKVTEIASDLDTYAALDALAVSDGGKILISGFLKDIISIVDTLANTYKKTPHLELIAECADLKVKLDSLRTITRAKTHKEMLQELLEEALKEE